MGGEWVGWMHFPDLCQASITLQEAKTKIGAQNMALLYPHWRAFRLQTIDPKWLPAMKQMGVYFIL